MSRLATTGPSFENGRAVLEFRSFDLDAYQAFLRAKMSPEKEVSYDWRTDTYRLTMPERFAPLLGGASLGAVHERRDLAGHLFDYQRFIVSQALAADRYAIYADCGLGKTPMQLEFGRITQEETKERFLWMAPLNVVPQTLKEARKFYDGDLEIRPLSTRAELEAWLEGDGDNPFGITNFQKLDDGPLPALRRLGGISVDESSMLKTGGGKRKWNLIHSCRGIQRKLSNTATPAPNEAMEHASQAAFLEKLRTEGEILWTFFSKDKDGEWGVKPHAKEAFYRFMASWSVYLRTPSAYGFTDNVSVVPDPVWYEHEVAATPEQVGIANAIFCEHGAGLFGDESLGIVPRNRLSQAGKGFLYHKDGKSYDRVSSLKPAEVARIATEELSRGLQVVIWTVFDAEGDLIAEHLPAGSYEYFDGRTPAKARPDILDRSERGITPILITKASSLGFGQNLQWIKSTIVSGIDDSFERLYQLVRRFVRYGQTDSVRIHVPIVRQLEGLQWENVQEKGRRFEAEAADMERCYRDALGLGQGGRRAA